MWLVVRWCRPFTPYLTCHDVGRALRVRLVRQPIVTSWCAYLWLSHPWNLPIATTNGCIAKSTLDKRESTCFSLAFDSHNILHLPPQHAELMVRSARRCRSHSDVRWDIGSLGIVINLSGIYGRVFHVWVVNPKICLPNHIFWFLSITILPFKTANWVHEKSFDTYL